MTVPKTVSTDRSQRTPKDKRAAEPVGRAASERWGDRGLRGADEPPRTGPARVPGGKCPPP